MQDGRAELEWRKGAVPVSVRFDDPYFSLENGLDEARHVFLGGNDLPARFRDGFCIAELGFGTGLNCLATVESWRAQGAPGVLRYVSFEAYPLSVGDMARSLAAFPEIEEYTHPLLEGWSRGARAIDLGHGVTLEVVEGDARVRLLNWDRCADAWYLDGFSPAKNPEMWGVDLMRQVARHTATGGTAATYTAAGFVRRGLEAAGFAVNRVPGYGRKRHMTRAVLV